MRGKYDLHNELQSIIALFKPVIERLENHINSEYDKEEQIAKEHSEPTRTRMLKKASLAQAVQNKKLSKISALYTEIIIDNDDQVALDKVEDKISKLKAMINANFIDSLTAIKNKPNVSYEALLSCKKNIAIAHGQPDNGYNYHNLYPDEDLNKLLERAEEEIEKAKVEVEEAEENLEWVIKQLGDAIDIIPPTKVKEVVDEAQKKLKLAIDIKLAIKEAMEAYDNWEEAKREYDIIKPTISRYAEISYYLDFFQIQKYYNGLHDEEKGLKNDSNNEINSSRKPLTDAKIEFLERFGLGNDRGPNKTQLNLETLIKEKGFLKINSSSEQSKNQNFLEILNKMKRDPGFADLSTHRDSNIFLKIIRSLLEKFGLEYKTEGRQRIDALHNRVEKIEEKSKKASVKGQEKHIDQKKLRYKNEEKYPDDAKEKIKQAKCEQHAVKRVLDKLRSLENAKAQPAPPDDSKVALDSQLHKKF